MTTVLHLITELDNGGAERMLYNLVRASDHRAVRHMLVSMVARGSVARRIQALDIPCFSLGMHPGRPSLFALARLVRLLRRLRPDVLQTWLYHADLMGLIGGKIAGVPHIAWNVRCSDIDLAKYPRSLAVLIRILAWVSRLPDLAIVNSEAGRDAHTCRGYRPKRWEVIPNGFDLEEFSPDPEAKPRLLKSLGAPGDSLLIGLIARFDPLKDHIVFLKASGRVGRAFQEARFVLAGQGVTPSNETLVREVVRQGLDGRVHLLDEREDIPDVMAGLDILVSSSYSEGFPNVIGEAMASGVPCAVTDAGDSRLIVGETGRVVGPKNSESLAKAVCDLIECGAEERARLGRAARERIRRLFDLDSTVARYEKLYLEICGENPAARE